LRFWEVFDCRFLFGKESGGKKTLETETPGPDEAGKRVNAISVVDFGRIIKCITVH